MSNTCTMNTHTFLCSGISNYTSCIFTIPYCTHLYTSCYMCSLVTCRCCEETKVWRSCMLLMSASEYFSHLSAWTKSERMICLSVCLSVTPPPPPGVLWMAPGTWARQTPDGRKWSWPSRMPIAGLRCGWGKKRGMGEKGQRRSGKREGAREKLVLASSACLHCIQVHFTGTIIIQ